MPYLSLTLFGSPRIEVDGEQVEINRRKAVALLVYLAVTRQSHSRDALSTLLWPEADQRRARAGLRSALWTLNKSPLADWLVVESEMVTFGSTSSPAESSLAWLRQGQGASPSSTVSGPALEIDVVRFRKLLAASRQHGHPATEACPACLDPLTKAVSLYQNDFMAGFTLPDAPEFDEWQYYQADSLRQGLATTLERLVQLHSTQGSYANAIPHALRHLNLDPLHEAGHRTLMKLYAHSGQKKAALRQYQLCLKTFDAELGLPPSEETTVLYERIRSGKLVPEKSDLEIGPVSIRKPAPIASTRLVGATLTSILAENKATGTAESIPNADEKTQSTTVSNGDSPLPTSHSPSSTRHNLPSQPTPFIGRKNELAALDNLIIDLAERLVTIVGSGGMGKTRLALAWAERQLETDRFTHGIYFVPLAPLQAAEQILPTLAEVLDFHIEASGPKRSPQQQILSYLRHKRMFIILDNFEHLLDGVELIAEILQTAPGVQILATSRERLDLQEEQVYPIQGLTIPHWETGEKAAQGQDGTKYTAVRLFLQSAQRLQPDYELAGTDQAALARICRLVEGMPLGLELAASWVDTLSLDDIALEVEQSLDLLETNKRNVPARHRSIRAVFETSWQHLSETEQDVFVQCSVFRGGFTRRALQEITDASIRISAKLTRKSLLHYNRANDRYQIHELLRQFSTEKLAEDPVKGTAVRDRHSAYYAEMLQQLEAALKSPEQFTALAEIEAEMENVRIAWDWAITQKKIAHIAQALMSLGHFYEWGGRYQEGAAACQAASSVVHADAEPRLRARLLTAQATFLLMLAQLEKARKLLDEALALLDSPLLVGHDTRPGRAAILWVLGRLAIFSQDRWSAIQVYEESLESYQALDDRWGMVKALNGLATATRAPRDEEADSQRHHLHDIEALAHKCITICREIGDQVELAEAFIHLTHAYQHLGYKEKALAAIEECIEHCLALNLKGHLIRAYNRQAILLLGFGRYVQAQAAEQLAYDLVQELGFTFATPLCLNVFGLIALAERRYEKAREWLQKTLLIYRERRQLPQLGRTSAYLGMAEHYLGNTALAKQHLIEVLQIAAQTRTHEVLKAVYHLAPLHFVNLGASRRAVELYGLLLTFVDRETYPFIEDVVGKHIQAEAILSCEDFAAAQALGHTLDPWATAEALLDELTSR
ncbi:MAG: BTAD domain-containing putative transcriptional regulator [Chloroflexota bacterium]